MHLLYQFTWSCPSSRPCLLWQPHPVDVNLQMTGWDELLPLHRTSSYQELNHSNFTLPSCRQWMQSDFLRRYESKLCNDSEINSRLCGLDLVGVGTEHRLAASALHRKQAFEPTAASLPPLPLYRCNSVGDKFAHPPFCLLSSQATFVSHAIAHIQLCSALLQAIVTFGQPLRGGFRA